MNKHQAVNEDVTDMMMRYIDEEAIRYFLKNQEESKARGVQSKFDYYRKLADNESDPVMKLMYEYSMLLPPEQALNLARDFYRKEIKSRTVSLDAYSGNDMDADDLGDSGSVLNTKFEYGNNLMDKGIFSTIAHQERRSPARNMEISDLLDKLFFDIGLSKEAKILLIARLMTGSSTGRSRINPAATLDLSSHMHRLPNEFNIVQKQYNDLLEAGVKPEDITANLIVNGRTATEDNPAVVKRLMAKYQITDANLELQDMIYKLSEEGVDDENALFRFMHVNEAVDPMQQVPKTIEKILSGKQVVMSDAIRAIVFAVAENYKLRSPLLKSKIFRDGKNISGVARKVLKLFKTGQEKNIRLVQFILMAPVIFRNAKARDLLKPLNSQGKSLAR